jgi:hypothetical protein
MDWYEQPAQAPPADRKVSGIRRGIATAVLAVSLLGIGGVAAVMAASPDPSAAPNASGQPSDNGTSPGASAAPRHGKGNCPNMGGNSNGSNSNANGSSGASNPDA